MDLEQAFCPTRQLNQQTPRHVFDVFAKCLFFFKSLHEHKTKHQRFHTNYRILQDDIPCFFYLNFFFHDLFSYFFKIIPPEDLGQNKSDYTSCNVAMLQCCCFVALICFDFIRRHLMLMIYALSCFCSFQLLFLSPLFLSDLSVHFDLRSFPPISLHRLNLFFYWSSGRHV